MYLNNIRLHLTSSSAALKDEFISMFAFGRFLKKMCQITILKFSNWIEKIEGNDLAHFFEETNKVKKILISGYIPLALRIYHSKNEITNVYGWFTTVN